MIDSILKLEDGFQKGLAAKCWRFAELVEAYDGHLLREMSVAEMFTCVRDLIRHFDIELEMQVGTRANVAMVLMDGRILERVRVHKKSDLQAVAACVAVEVFEKLVHADNWFNVYRRIVHLGRLRRAANETHLAVDQMVLTHEVQNGRYLQPDDSQHELVIGYFNSDSMN